MRIEADFNEWFEWALREQLDPSVLGYLKYRGHFASVAPIQWGRMSKVLTLAPNVQGSNLAEIAKGLLGDNIGEDFMKFRAVLNEAVDAKSQPANQTA
jgi:hypothetical protein